MIVKLRISRLTMAEKPVSGNQLPENRDKKNFWTDSSTVDKVGVVGLLLAFIAR
ncbi:hypothetical protein [Dyadobacter sp. OTU695]|uniref:hypothetical protein n=1 Tax=Dyadobacter sp. OTU695 TaxID=3043860 RepID=UPI00313C4988